MGDMVCTEEDDAEDDWVCCLLMGGGSAAMDSGASYTSSPDCSMVTHSNWSLSFGFSCVAEGTTGALTCERPSGRLEFNPSNGDGARDNADRGHQESPHLTNWRLEERRLASLHAVNRTCNQ